MTTLTWNRYPDRAPDPRWADNWEDDPERHKLPAWRPSEMDARRKAHHGLTGPGMLLRQIIKEVRDKKL